MGTIHGALLLRALHGSLREVETSAASCAPVARFSLTVARWCWRSRLGYSASNRETSSRTGEGSAFAGSGEGGSGFVGAATGRRT